MHDDSDDIWWCGDIDGNGDINWGENQGVNIYLF
jgi:hypothetical protein